MTTCFLAPDPIQSTQLVPGSNTPANGGQLFFYQNLTTTKQTVYKDPTASVAWSNPIVLDSGGNLPSGGEVWFTQSQTYTVVFAPASDTDPPASPYWTKNNLTGTNDAGLQNQYVLIAEKSITTATTAVAFSTDVAWSGYRELDFRLYNVYMQGTSSIIGAQVSNDGGANFISAGYSWQLNGQAVIASTAAATAISTYVTGGTAIAVTAAFMGQATFPVSTAPIYAELRIFDPSVPAPIKYYYLEQANYYSYGGQMVRMDGLSINTNSPAGISAVRFVCAGGTVSSGTVKCFGVPN